MLKFLFLVPILLPDIWFLMLCISLSSRKSIGRMNSDKPRWTDLISLFKQKLGNKLSHDSVPRPIYLQFHSFISRRKAAEMVIYVIIQPIHFI